MKKKTIQLGAAAAVLLGLLGVFLWLRQPPEAAEEIFPEPEKTYVAGMAEGPVPARIDVTNEHGMFVITNKAPKEERPELTIEGWESFSLDSYALSGAFSAARAMEAKSVINETPTDEELFHYGLAHNRSTVIVTFEDGGGKAEILIGNDAPGGEGAYVKRADNPAVYLVSPGSASPFTRPATDYISLAVTEDDPEFKSFDKAVLSGALYNEPVVIERSPETQQEFGGMVIGSHQITSPVETGVSSNGMNLLAALYGITAEHIEAVGDDAETLRKFGLDTPDMTVDVKGPDDGISFTLRVSRGDGNADEHGHGGHIYLLKSGLPVIFSVHDGALPWFGAPLFDIMERMPLMPNINNVSRVTVTTPEKAFVFELSGEGSDLVVTHDGAAIETADFRPFYQTLISAHYTEEMPEHHHGLQEKRLEAEDEAHEELLTLESSEIALPAILEIEYRYRDGSTADTVRFYPGPVRRAVISVNGGQSFYTASAYVERVLEDVIKVAGGEKVKSFF